MKMGWLGLGRRGQGAGDAADVCDVSHPKYMIFVLFFYYSNIFTVSSTYYGDNDSDTTTRIRETRAGGSRRCRHVSNPKYMFCFCFFFSLLIYYSVFYVVQQR